MEDKPYLFSGADLDIFGGSAFKDDSLRTGHQSSFDCKNLDGVGELPSTKNQARFDQRSFIMLESQAEQRLKNIDESSGGRAQEWWYTDPTGALQGPFHYTKMREWYNQGFFKHHLPIRCHQNTPFIPLGKWFASNNPAFCDKVPDNWREITEYEDKEESSPTSKPEATQALYSSSNITTSILPALPLTSNTTKSKSDWWESPTTASFNNENWRNSGPRREFQPASKIPTSPPQTGPNSKLIIRTITDTVLQAGGQVNAKGRNYLTDATPASWPLNMESLNQRSPLNEPTETRRTTLPGSNENRVYGSGTGLTGTSPASSSILKGLGYEPVPSIEVTSQVPSNTNLQGSPTASHQQPARQQEETNHRIEQLPRHHVPVRKPEQPTWSQKKPAQVQRNAERRPDACLSKVAPRKARGGQQQLSWVQRTSSHRGGAKPEDRQQQVRNNTFNKKVGNNWGGQAGHKQPRSTHKVNSKEAVKKSFAGGRKEESKKKREDINQPPLQTNLENPFGGQKMSPDFAKWCKEQLAELSKPDENDFTDLVKFLMSLNSEKETREVIMQYLGNTPKVLTFADGFLLRKDFDHENLTKGLNRGGVGDGKKSGARRRRGGRRT